MPEFPWARMLGMAPKFLLLGWTRKDAVEANLQEAISSPGQAII